MRLPSCGPWSGEKNKKFGRRPRPMETATFRPCLCLFTQLCPLALIPFWCECTRGRPTPSKSGPSTPRLPRWKKTPSENCFKRLPREKKEKKFISPYYWRREEDTLFRTSCLRKAWGSVLSSPDRIESSPSNPALCTPLPDKHPF